MNAFDTLNTVFDLAISREEAANKFYVNLAKRVMSSAVKDTFSELAAEELRHKALLLALKAEPQIQAKFKSVPNYHVAESEAAPDLTANMSLRDAVAVAMKNEQQAAEMYRVLASLTTDEAVRTLFENLTNMELGHKNSLETLFVDIAYPEVF